MATVFVWENHFIARNATDRTWTGHACMSIDDVFADNRPLEDDGSVNESSTNLMAGNDRYVSFWPGKAVLTGMYKGDSPAQHPFTRDCWKPGISYMASCKPSIFADVATETYAPDHVIRIDGLSVTKMKAKWQSIKRKDLKATYAFLRKNCSTIVGRVLSAAVPWHKTPHYLVWTPTDVRDFALKLGTAMLYADFITELEQAGYCSSAQLNALRQVKRRSAARGTSGGLAKHA